MLTPSETEDRLVIDLVGDLAGILAIASGEQKSRVSSHLNTVWSDQQEVVVAGAGFTLCDLVSVPSLIPKRFRVCPRDVRTP